MLVKGSTAMEGLSGSSKANLSMDAVSTVGGAGRTKNFHINRVPELITNKVARDRTALGHFLQLSQTKRRSGKPRLASVEH